MTKFRITIATVLLMLPAVPYADLFAVSADSPVYTHYIYMFGHAGWLHWLINAWTLMVMHNAMRWYRVLAAYLWAVGESYFLLPSQPMVGLSVFNCFFIGFAAPWLWKRDRLALAMTVALLLLTCVISGFAGIQHMASFLFGLSFSLCEGRVCSILDYLNM